MLSLRYPKKQQHLMRFILYVMIFFSNIFISTCGYCFKDCLPIRHRKNQNDYISFQFEEAAGEPIIHKSINRSAFASLYIYNVIIGAFAVSATSMSHCLVYLLFLFVVYYSKSLLSCRNWIERYFLSLLFPRAKFKMS